MSELSRILEREGRTVDLDPGHYERLLRRRDRRRRNRRVGSALLAIAITGASIGYAYNLVHRRSEPIPMDRITSRNVGRLGLAWTASAPVSTGTTGSPSVRDGIVYADVGTGEGMGGLEGFPLACPASAGSCLPTWSADASHNLAGIVLDERSLYVGEGVSGQPYSVPATGRSRVDAFARSCETGRCRPTWTSRPVHAGLSPIALIGGRLYVRMDDTLQAYARSCGHPVCDPVWTGYDVGPPAFVGGRAVVRTRSGVAVFSSACWTARGPACRQIWTGEIDVNVDPTLLPPPVVADGRVLLDDAAGVRAFPIDCHDSCSAEWEARVPGGPGFEPVIADGMMFAAADGASGLFAFRVDCPNASDGGTCIPEWVGHTDEGVGFQPLVTEGHVVVATSLGSTLLAFPASCADPCPPAWSAELDDSIADPPIASDDLILVPGLGSVSAFPSGCTDPCGAIFQWGLPQGSTQMTPLVDGDAMIVVGGDTMYALRLGSPAPAAETPRTWARQPGILLFAGALFAVVAAVTTRRRRRAFP